MMDAQKTVMIIEDEPDAAEMFAEMMRLNGFRVIKMFSSAPAIPMIAQEKPDVIILDIMMPDISGLEVLRYMRREPDLSPYSRHCCFRKEHARRYQDRA